MDLQKVRRGKDIFQNKNSVLAIKLINKSCDRYVLEKLYYKWFKVPILIIRRSFCFRETNLAQTSSELKRK